MKILTDRFYLPYVMLAVICVLRVLMPDLVLGQDPVPKKHALVFGINQYAHAISGVPQLKWAKKDADEINKFLDEQQWDARGFFNENVSRRTIIRELTRLAREANQQDTLLVYFAGHGVRDTRGRKHTYWLTYTSNLANLAIEGIRLKHLMDFIQDIPATRKLILLDHCNSGDVEYIPILGGSSSRNVATGSPTLKPVASRDLFPKDEITVSDAQTDGIAILGSARDAAYEFEEFKHGLFTYGLLEALKDPDTDGDKSGRLTLSEVWKSAQRKMTEAKNDLRQKGVISRALNQVPVEVLRGSGLMDWDLFDAFVEPDVGAEKLNEVIDTLKRETDFGTIYNGLAEAYSRQAILDWEASVEADVPPGSSDKAIVDKLKQIRGLDAQIRWDVRKVMLIGVLKDEGYIND